MIEVLFVAVSLLCAQPGGLEQDVARAVAAAADATRPLEDRRVSAMRAIELRRALLVAEPDDPRRGIWMIDQAGALLARLGEDGADAAVMFQADVFDQRRRVEADVAEVRGLIEAAPAALRGGIAALDATGDLAGASDLRAAERDVRLEFFDARSALLAASMASGQERRRLGLRAVRAASDLELEGSAEAARLTTIGLGALYAEEVAAAEAALQAALDMAAEGVVPRSVWCEAIVGMASCASSRGDIDGAVRRLDAALTDMPVVEDGRADAALGLVMLGVRARTLIDARLISDAFDAHRRVLRVGFPGVDPGASRSLVLESMAMASSGLSDLAALPPEVGFARGVHLSRDEATRREAIDLLDDVARRPDAGSLAGDALWERAVLLLDGDGEDVIEAVESLTRLATLLPGADRAPAALEAALAYGNRLASNGVGNEAYDAALEVVREGRPAIKDRSFWLLEHARRSIRAGRLDDALSTLEIIPPSDGRHEESATLYGAAVRAQLDAWWSAMQAARIEGREDDVRRLAEREVVPLASRAVVYARERELGWVGQVRADLADARTEAGQTGARVLYQRLLDDGVQVSGGRVRLLLGLSRSLLLAGERERAFAHLLEASDVLGEAVPASDAGHERFWHIWTLILEMQAEENADGSRSGVIHAHIVRLETIDPSLGGTPWRGRIDEVRDSTP